MTNRMTPEWSYPRHSEVEVAGELPSCYAVPQSIDCWRHKRMLGTVLPLVEALPESSWMTIGDGRYGSDASFLHRRGVNVLAKSISDTALAIAHDGGFIDKFKAQNAGCLTEPDNAFDFVLCKESYHHFPRPPVAFYEMFRVASVAIVLIEPIDRECFRPLDWLRALAKRFLRGQGAALFEPSGNFLFRLNLREIEKMATAMNASHLAVRKFNDFFLRQIARREYRRFSRATLVTQLGIFVQNVLCMLRFMSYGLATIVVFKDLPSAQIVRNLEVAEFSVTKLPRNPYLDERRGDTHV